MADLLRTTASLCPVCLASVPARLAADGDRVTLEGTCSAHGDWRTVVWSGPPGFSEWCGDEVAPAARQTCTAVLEVTQTCDLGCPVCFAESGPGRPAEAAPPGAGAAVARPPADPSVAELAARLTRLAAAEGAVNLQLSGGEPTTRDDLPQIIAAAAAAGITFIQLNTNGLRLADEPGYAETLRDAGLASVFLQFDGLSDDTYRIIRGRSLLARKLRAVERCAEAGLAVVLVPTVVPRVNDGELGDLVRFAASWPGVVRGLHLQPISYFGRYPRRAAGGGAAGAAPTGGAVQGGGDLPRLTLPELLRRLENQTGGEVRAADFSGSCCEHVRCSFRARYWVRDGGRLEPVRAASSCGCGPAAGDFLAPPRGVAESLVPEEASRRAVAATSRQWSRRDGPRQSPSGVAAGCCEPPAPVDDLSRFLADADRILAISGMLFQDAWSIDMERIDRCCVQVVTEPGRHIADGLVPFCLWNLTSASGERLYPR